MVHDCFFFVVFVDPGVLAVSDPRGPAADPPESGLGASGGVALYGAGGLLTEQVTSHISTLFFSSSTL